MIIRTLSNMSLCDVTQKDYLVLSKSRNDVFSVRSTYYNIMEELIDTIEFRKEGDWIELWKLKVPK